MPADTLMPTMHSARRDRSALVATAALLLACASASDAPRVDELPTPAGEGAVEPFLATAPDGRVLLSWLEPAGDSSHALRVSAWDGDGWSEPSTVMRRADLFVNWADFPSVLALPNGDLVVHWLQRSGAGPYAYDVRVARSTDGGRTWSDGVVPHRDGMPAEHGFVSLWAADGDSVAVAWLDGRKYAGTGEGAGETMLVTTRIGRDGGMASETILDPRICDCCQTDLAIARAGPVIVYRDRSPDEIRDVWLVRWTDGRWSAPAPVHADGWRIEGCPVNGPQVSAAGDTVAVAWFTAAEESGPQVRLAISTDGGATFGPPVRVDDGQPLGRVDVVMTPRGPTVSWLERAGADAATVRVRHHDWRGRARGVGVVVDSSSAARSSGFPRMAWGGDGIVLAWTDVSAQRLRIARVSP